MTKYILFYDSGVGGISTLNATIKRLPHENYLYLADNKNCPYGDKSPSDIEDLVHERLNWLLKRYKVKMVVFACNTITTTCIDKMRASYNLPFVGTEPAIALAMENSKSKEILVLATEVTIRQKRLLELSKKAEGKVYLLSLKGLADEIERARLNREEVNMTKYIEKIKRAVQLHPKIDSIVLGCTHYCFVKKQLEDGLKLSCYDGNDGVAKRVEYILNKMGQKEQGRRGKVKVRTSGGGRKRALMYEKMVMRIKV